MIGNNFSETDFGDRLMRRRKKCGFRSQADLAEKIMPISQDDNEDGDEYARNVESKRKTISNWERGKATPSLADLIALCNILDCDIEYLIGDIDVPKKEVADVMAVTGLTQKAVDAFLQLSKDDMEILNEILVSPHLLELISAISKGAESPIIKKELIIEFMKERLGGKENEPFVKAVRKYIAEDMDKTFKFKATDSAGKLFDTVSEIVYERREMHG